MTAKKKAGDVRPFILYSGQGDQNIFLSCGFGPKRYKDHL